MAPVAGSGCGTRAEIASRSRDRTGNEERPGSPTPHVIPSRSPAFALHPLAQNRVDPAEVSLAFRFEPGEDIVVNAERDLGFEGTIVFSDHPLRPLRGWQLGYVGMIQTAIPLLVSSRVRLLILTGLVLVDALLIRHRLSCGNDVNDLDCRLAAIDANNDHQTAGSFGHGSYPFTSWPSC